MPNDIFQLKPFKAAKVSEISEATAAAPVSDAERINFHIGHPIGDQRLTAFFRHLIFASADVASLSTKDDFTAYLREQGYSPTAIQAALFVYETIPLCNPYAPRGGYNRKAPGPLIERLQNWFEKEQLEPIRYDSGLESGQKELMLGSGGITENMRILFFTLQRTLPLLPAQIFLYRSPLPDYLKRMADFRFIPLPDDDDLALKTLRQHLNTLPSFLLLGQIPGEPFRRRIREWSLQKPLFIVERNNAPNHLSLAREALLADRVLRFLSPQAINENLRDLSVVIVAGRADYIQRLETVHFELKGTPSAPEAELLFFLLQNNRFVHKQTSFPSPVFSYASKLNRFPFGEHLLRSAENFARRPSVSSPQHAKKTIEHAQETVRRISQNLYRLPGQIRDLPDSFASLAPTDLIEHFFNNLSDKAWTKELETNFLNTFVTVHPEYDRSRCLAVSGSARTALGILGFHGPIRKVMTLDLSWTYEHCFPQVDVLPLNPLQPFTADQLIAEMEQQIERDPSYLHSGALILNNPHNATGRILPAGQLKEVVRRALNRGLFVIDDLSYQNVGPWAQSKRVKTLKQHVLEMQQNGLLGSEQAKRLLTVHSLSKTDSFAGARLTVVELPDPKIFDLFANFLKFIVPHRLPLLIAYMFYRNSADKVAGYWDYRNRLFAERMQALLRAVNDLPEERNPFGAEILPPEGSMYPLLFIRNLPSGISLDALSSNLANQGIGLIPLTTFARTASGFETARNAFRLTLGGQTRGEKLYYQMRRVLIDLNRLIAQEASVFQKKSFPVPSVAVKHLVEYEHWQAVSERIFNAATERFGRQKQPEGWAVRDSFRHFLNERLRTLSEIFSGRLQQWQRLLKQAPDKRARMLATIWDTEFYKDDLSLRQNRFRHRLFDRTVHPTQIFSLQTEQQTRAITETILTGKTPDKRQTERLAEALLNEFRGQNVPVNSVQEADELLLDLDSFIESEIEAAQAGARLPLTMLSFWGDWDGSTRPSGQGHRLVAAVIIENVVRLARILSLLHRLEPDLPIDARLLSEIERIPVQKDRFWHLLNKITTLTNQLEKRYRTLLPTEPQISRWRKTGIKLHLMHDPWTVIWEHNDRLERKMLQLRQQRRKGLEYYFRLNKKLRKALHQAIPLLLRHSDNAQLLYFAGFYRDLLKRFVLTPRIHQNMITSIDPFAIDTTVFNLQEINEIGTRFGNGGLILGLQVSMTSKSEALIQLDQKLRAQKETILRKEAHLSLPHIWVIPLFEDFEVVRNIDTYLNDLWHYARTHRSASQSAEDRFAEMICEIFIAGSDLSQQVSQPVAAKLYKETKFKVVRWLAQKGLTDRVRLKLGSGEPMQRQGGFYDTFGGKQAFRTDKISQQIIRNNLKPSAAQSSRYAITPLRGVMQSGDLRTFQSTICERLRLLPPAQRAELLYHISQIQQYHDRELIRAAEPLILTRLKFHDRGEKELKRLTMGWPDPVYDQFLQRVQAHFREIIYGREEDAVGIHVVSYFISRMIPSFRDRPTVRPGSATTPEAGQRIIARLSRVLPLARYGTMLRAIGHNRAQTMILGINQLTTGLFRALKEFAAGQHDSPEARLLIQERILPFLPVYEILHTLRLYQDVKLEFFRPLQGLFPAGNNAVAALHEDLELMYEYLPLLQWELLKRHGLAPAEFTENGSFKQALLPAIRPDLAVLLQKDLFNTDPKALYHFSKGSQDWQKETARLLAIPVQIHLWRENIWQLIAAKVAVQVESFNQLALAISVLLKNRIDGGANLSRNVGKLQRTSLQLSTNLQHVSDENLKQFLMAAVHYLGSASQGTTELPVNVMRALRDVERILRIEQQPLSSAEQDQLRFFILQIARLTGENG